MPGWAASETPVAPTKEAVSVVLPAGVERVAEGDDQQEGEQHLDPGEDDPELLEELVELTIEHADPQERSGFVGRRDG